MGSLLVVLFWSNNGHNGHNGLVVLYFHSCRSGPERSCFHVEEGVLRPTQVPWSIELWLHPIRPISFGCGILPHRRSSCLRLVIHFDSLRVVASVAQMAHMLLS